MAGQHFQCVSFYSCPSQESGWSETVYASVSDWTAAATKLKTYVVARLALLLNDCYYIYGRVSDVDIKGDSLPVVTDIITTGDTVALAGTLTGATGDVTDEVSLANLIRISATPVYRGMRFLHGIPESMHKGTLPQFATAYVTALGVFETMLINNFKLRVHDKDSGLVTYKDITNVVPEKLRNHRVGRPFGQPRGRR